MNNNLKISELIRKSIVGELSENERIVLDNWIIESSENKQLFKKLTNVNYQLQKLHSYNLFNREKVQKRIEEEIFEVKARKLSPNWTRYAAAILIPLIIAGGISFFYNTYNKITLANIDDSITPGTQKATLILSNGTSIRLDKNYAEGSINEGGVAVTNQDSVLHYKQGGVSSIKRKQLVYNELKTPRGGGYTLQLSDGTTVWLNSGSSLKFPVEFTDTTRQVYLIGEAYFDVSNTGKPFMVNANNVDIRVLGTQFNVSAYDDEEAIITTLVEGKVAVGLNSKTEILTPGLQASMVKRDETIEITEVNTAQYTSWIKGKLEFNNHDLAYVMKRLARWYDFEYTFKNEHTKTYRFSARISTNESISEILNMLEMTTNVSFNIENNKIVIN